MKQALVALLTDFGTRDGYAGVLKAVLLSRYPALRVVDLSHEIDPFQILSGAYLLYAAWDYFPPGSAFCAVVDPGVGSERGALLAREGGRFLVAPDNGLVSLLARMKTDRGASGLEVSALNEAAVRELFPLPAGRPVSSTFHGRDLFAPAAALCAAGLADPLRGSPLAPVLLPQAGVSRGRDGLRGWVMHVDRFGNCITSIHSSDLQPAPSQTSLTVKAAGTVLAGPARTYADARPGEPLALLGSAGFLEISVREGSASARLGLSVADPVTVLP